MNRIEFLERLEKLLADVPYTERREALNYYTEYFDDAEKDDEEVIRTLGSPEEAAHNIREELAGKELTQIGDTPVENTAKEAGTDKRAGKGDEKRLEGWQIALIILAAVVLFPVYGGIILGALGTCIGVIAGFFGVILGLMAAGVGCAVASVCVLVVAIVKFAVSPLASLFLIGLSVFLAGVAMLCMIAGFKSLTVLVPAIFKGIAYIWKSIFHRKEGVAV